MTSGPKPAANYFTQCGAMQAHGYLRPLWICILVLIWRLNLSRWHSAHGIEQSRLASTPKRSKPEQGSSTVRVGESEKPKLEHGGRRIMKIWRMSEDEFVYVVLGPMMMQLS